jgi:ferredoxin-nitrate reductase
VRVDTQLAPGVSEADVERWVQSASVLHSNGDALDIAVKDGRIVGVRGRAVDRVNLGRLDIKDLYGWQPSAHPTACAHRWCATAIAWSRPTGTPPWAGSSTGRGACWPGPAGGDAMGSTPAVSCSSRAYYTLAVIGKAGIGTPHMDGNTRLCTATAAAALKASFGTDGQPGSYTDVDHCDALALWGHNVAETQPVLWMRMLDRRTGADPPALVVVDPRPHGARPRGGHPPRRAQRHQPRPG